jgi:hypothetical protein
MPWIPDARQGRHGQLPGLLTRGQGGWGGAAPLARRFLRSPTHLPLHLHAI